MTALLLFAIGNDGLDPHVLRTTGPRSAALCGYAPYDHWKRTWTRPGESLALMALCGRCRAVLAKTGTPADGQQALLEKMIARIDAAAEPPPR